MTISYPTLYAEKLIWHANNSPDTLAVWTPTATRTYSELVANAKRIGGALQAANCHPGDRIVMLTKSSCTAADLTVAATLIRCVPTPMSTSVQPETIALLLEDSTPKVIFSEKEFLGLLSSAKLANTVVVVLDEDGEGGFQKWLAENDQAIQPTEARPDDILTILYSSGTTSIPKGMTHTNGPRVAFWDYQAKIGGGMLSGSRYGLTTAFYTSGTFSSLMATLYGGGTVALLPKFDPEQFIALVEKGLINTAFLVPVQIRRILDAEGYSKERMANFKYAMVSGSACDQTTKQRIIDQWPGKMIDAYGSSETMMLAFDDMKSVNRKPGSVGLIQDYAKVLILDENDQPLSSGESGEIVASTPGQMIGYYNQPQQTRDAEWVDKDGTVYLRTGDIGYVDEQGYLYLTDRKKDMIVSGGVNVYSSDIEAVLSQRQDVREAAVIAIPSERWGETPYAFVVLVSGAKTDPDELRTWVNQRLGKTARISGLEFIPELPRNDMGKVTKKTLREPFWQGRDVRIA